MRSHPARTALLPLALGLVAAALAGCASSASPVATAAETPAAPATGPAPTFDGATAEGSLLLTAASELDEAILPAGFRYVETVDIDLSGSTSSIYVQGQPEEQGPGLYVYAVPEGVDVEYLGDDWAPEPVPELSGDLAVTVVSDPEGQDRSVVSIEAPPAGTVRLIGDGLVRDELIGMAGRLLDSLGDAG